MEDHSAQVPGVRRARTVTAGLDGHDRRPPDTAPRIWRTTKVATTITATIATTLIRRIVPGSFHRRAAAAKDGQPGRGRRRGPTPAAGPSGSRDPADGRSVRVTASEMRHGDPLGIRQGVP